MTEMKVTKVLSGITALIDAFDFTAQAKRLGEANTAKFLTYFHDKIRAIVESRRYQVLDAWGGIVLIYGTEPSGIVEIMADLFGPRGPEDRYGFVARFRMAAHSGFFHFVIEDGQPAAFERADIISSSRWMESQQLSKPLVLITQPLFVGIRDELSKHNMPYKSTDELSVTGFDGETWYPPFYIIDVDDKIDLVEKRMNKLESDVQKIPVFGNLYPPISMGKDFVNLSVYIKSETTNHGDPLEKSLIPIDIKALVEKNDSGIILGLPGSGKTTILKYIAYSEFMSNSQKSMHEKQVVLFIDCSRIPGYDQWFEVLFKENTGKLSHEIALAYMTWAFVFENLPVEELRLAVVEQFHETLKVVNKAFWEERLTLLIDGLDTAPNSKAKEYIYGMFRILVSNKNGNRLYLTARRSERKRFLGIERGVIGFCGILIPPDRLEQWSPIAAGLIGRDSSLLEKFNRAIAEERLEGIKFSPVLVQLVAAYFLINERLEQRFLVYDIVMKFILIREWEWMRVNDSHISPPPFFEEVKDPDFFDDKQDIYLLYRVLSALCFELLYNEPIPESHRYINKDKLKKFSIMFIQSSQHYIPKEDINRVIDNWFRLLGDHLLLEADSDQYFFYPSIVDYLAAYHIGNESWNKPDVLSEKVMACVRLPEFLEFNTLPLAAGSNLMTGFEILYALGEKHIGEANERLFDLAYECLVEVECLIEKAFQSILIEALKKPFMEAIRKNRESMNWLYRYLTAQVLSTEKDSLQRNILRFKEMRKLCRVTFLEEYLDHEAFRDGDTELQRLRDELLDQLIRPEIKKTGLKKSKKRKSRRTK